MRVLVVSILAVFAGVFGAATGRSAPAPIYPTDARCILISTVNPRQTFGFTSYDYRFTNRCAKPIEFFLCMVRATSGGFANQLCASSAYRVTRVGVGQSVTYAPPGWPATFDLNECPQDTRAIPVPARQPRYCTR